MKIAQIKTATALAAFLVAGNLQAQESSMKGMEGHGATQAVNVPEACRSEEGASMPMMEMSSAMTEHHEAMMKGMMATHPAMEQGMMAEDPDVAFACSMIPHHQAAITMAEVELQYGGDDSMKELAQEIIDAQKGEIEVLTTWIEENAK